MGHQEQSVDDILASIRRIIADDVPDRQGAGSAQSGVDDEEPQPTVEIDEIEDEDEPLLLSDPAPAQAARTGAIPGSGLHDVLLLNDPLDPVPGTASPLRDQAHPQPWHAPSGHSSQSPSRTGQSRTGQTRAGQANAGKAGQSNPVPPRAATGPAATVSDDRPDSGAPSAEPTDLLSQATRQAVAEAFAQIESEAGSRRGGTGTASDAASQSIEDLVRTALKPVLRDWLDNHLPGMVQTIVEDEIARLKARDRR